MKVRGESSIKKRKPAARGPTQPPAAAVPRRKTSSSIPVLLTGGNSAEFRRSLLRWYRISKRELPWRRDSDPYRVWVSEIMLQQTQVASVVPHYERFLERFPDLASLAAAEEDQVVAQWSGLGYYSRARNLHRAACQVAEQGGVFPKKFQDMLALPGIGRYTAGAIASIAFGQKKPLVDGNVRRLFQRFFGKALRDGELWSIAEELVPARHAGDYNQALMEIGATICLPREPLCHACPVSMSCRTRGNSRLMPTRSIRQQPRGMILLVLRRGSRFWLQMPSPKEQLLRSLWCFPMQWGGPSLDTLQRRLLRRFDLSDVKQAGLFRHSIMKYRFLVSVLTGKVRGRPEDVGVWVTPQQIGEYPHSSLLEKALALLNRHS